MQLFLYFTIHQLNTVPTVGRCYLNAISKDGRHHLKQQCKNQHPDSSDATTVQWSAACVPTAAINRTRPLVCTSHNSTKLQLYKTICGAERI